VENSGAIINRSLLQGEGYYTLKYYGVEKVSLNVCDEENNNFVWGRFKSIRDFNELVNAWEYHKLVHVDAEGNQRYPGTLPEWWKSKGFSTVQQAGELKRVSITGVTQMIPPEFYSKMRLCHPEAKGTNVIECYANLRDYLRDKKTPMKPGKFYRMCFPEATDAEVEDFVNKYREKFSDKGYTLHVGSTSDDFELAYGGDCAPSETPATTSARKSLKDSCMQHDFGFKFGHPARVYGSGDFSVVYLKDPKGRIGGRVVIYNGNKEKKPQAGPCYGVCEKSLNMLEEYLEKLNCDTYQFSCWEGAKLLAIWEDGGYLMPYLDVAPCNFDEASDGNFVLSYDGSYEAGSTDGINYLEPRHSCECCGESVSDEDVCCNEDGYVYCSYCYNDKYVQDEDGNEIHIDDAVRVYQTTRYGTMGVWMHCDSEDWAECEATNGAWHIDDILTNCVDYGYVCKEYAEEYMKLNEDGDYHYEKELEEETA
jgi:hypothetical protein